ncbi:MAG: FKBP-type peptidyl-prolyl cis-trans isomerase [Dermatophilaceae bacterium]
MRRARPLLALLMAAVLVGGAAACTSDGSSTAAPSATATAFGTDADLKVLESVTVTESLLPTSSETTSPAAAASTSSDAGASTSSDAGASTSPATGDASSPQQTSAAASPTTVPTLTLATTPVSVSATTRRIVTSGSGPLSGSDSLVAAHLAVYLGSTGQQLDSTYAQDEPLKLALSNGETIAGLLKGLTGVQAGSRVLIGISPDDAYGSQGNQQIGVSGTETLLVLADILTVATPLSQAEGTSAAPAAGLPGVTFDAATGPTISIPPGVAAPTETVSQVLVEGSGPPVSAGQLVSVHYTGVLWKDGSVFDSSWTRKAPLAFQAGQGQVIAAWDSQLVGKKVGSRVLLVVPPKDGYGPDGNPPKISGTDTLVFVVDILGAL